MKKTISYICLLICNIFIFNFLFAQTELRYKDVYEAINNKSEEEAYAILREYQQQDPFSANAYYQLGVISQTLAKRYDPLTEYNDLKHFVYHADLYLNLSLKYLDEKEARKNRNYYQYVEIPEGQKKIEFLDILNDVNNRIADINIFKKNINLIRKNYLGIVENYNNCVKIFLDINSKNNKLKDIYLTADIELINIIGNLRSHFDSSIVYFDNYKKAIADFPIKNYNQEYSVIPIETYRLHGLTNSDFLDNNIFLWDYKTWVEKVLAVIEKDIKDLRHEIDATAKEMQAIKSVLNITKDFTTSYENYKLDEKLIYKIGKFDYQPIILDLFYYNQQKINLIIEGKDPYNNPDFVIDRNFDHIKYLNYYYELIDKKLNADNDLLKLENNISEYKIHKYSSFFAEDYKGIDGLFSYIKKERNKNNEIIDKSMSLLKKYIVPEIADSVSKTKFIAYKKSSIPCFKTEVNLLNPVPTQYYTNDIKLDNYGNYYLTGYFNPAKGNKSAFIAKADSTLNLKWLKKYDYSSKEIKYDNIGLLLELTEYGCITIIRSLNSVDTLEPKNSFVRLASDGEELINKKIGHELVPRFFLFDELNEKMLLAYYKDEIAKPDSLYKMVIDYTDSTGFILWKTKIKFQGNIVGIVRTNENFLLVGNFNKLIDNNNNLYEVKGNTSMNTNAFTAFLNSEGEIQSIKTFELNTSFYLTEAVKLNSEVINLLGIKGFRTDALSTIKSDKVKVAYKLINVNGDEFYSYEYYK